MTGSWSFGIFDSVVKEQLYLVLMWLVEPDFMIFNLIWVEGVYNG